jgi:hypothetical protein
MCNSCQAHKVINPEKGNYKVSRNVGGTFNILRGIFPKNNVMQYVIMMQDIRVPKLQSALRVFVGLQRCEMRIWQKIKECQLNISRGRKRADFQDYRTCYNPMDERHENTQKFWNF